MSQVTMRPRYGYAYHTLSEIGIEVLHVAMAATQLVAAFGFFPGSSFYTAACWAFVVTSMTSLALMLHSGLDSWHHIRVLLPALKEARGKAELEVEESFIYGVSSVMFAAGSLLYLPFLNVSTQRSDVSWGTWLFLLGSFLLWLASFVNSLNVYDVGPFAQQTRSSQLGVVSLLFTQMGSICYAVGTVGYFPQLEGEGQAWSPVWLGSVFYVIGGGAYLIAASLTLGVAVTKHRDAQLVAQHKAMLHAHGKWHALLFAHAFARGGKHGGASGAGGSSSRADRRVVDESSLLSVPRGSER